ncbi:YjfB family protein [Propionispora hippei]|uniref:Motility protein n=1 Tax=Propionispora hippei DSM 15287 TaxID=1123003 RepID=A0A1M6H5A7_9FIRM|nr:YjfB family protein [Propionispora hippei]SHJ17374.1 Putative motility protein [Propionispora hippei DSM 15287]
MDIAALSVAYSLSQVQTDASIQVLKKVMDTTETNSAEMLDMLVPPSATLGSNVDVSV